MAYKSPLRICENFPTLVVYKCSKTEALVGKVYKTSEGKWYLATRYLHWQPMEVFSKIGGFLFLLRLHKQQTHISVKRSGRF